MQPLVGAAQLTAAPGNASDAADGVSGADGVSVSLLRNGVLSTVAASDQTIMAMDADQYALAALSEDHREAVAAFFEKRPGKFTGR